jgi:hypothetical protein
MIIAAEAIASQMTADVASIANKSRSSGCTGRSSANRSATTSLSDSPKPMSAPIAVKPPITPAGKFDGTGCPRCSNLITAKTPKNPPTEAAPRIFKATERLVRNQSSSRFGGRMNLIGSFSLSALYIIGCVGNQVDRLICAQSQAFG